MASIWAAYTKAQLDAQQLLLNFLFIEPNADWLGFNRTDSTQTLEAAFADTTRLCPLATVTAGMSLGTFANNAEAGIEFIIFDRFYRPTIDDLRKAEMCFTVPLTSGSIPGHDTNYVDQRARENILNYIDPAAYYTMHYRIGVNYKDSSGTTHLCSTAEAIGSQLLSSFVPSQNRIYLDIRNELGSSLNFYRDNEGTGSDQGIHIQYGYDKNAPLTPKNYYTNNWPIFSEVINPASVNATTIALQVRQAHNPQPLLFLDYGYPAIAASTLTLKPDERFTDVTQTNATDWSEIKELKLLSPSTVTFHPIWFIKIMCIRQVVPANLPAVVPTAPPRRYVLDHVFGPFRTDMLNASEKGNKILPGKKYMAGLDGGAIVHVRKIQGTTELTFQVERLFVFGKYSLLPFTPAALWPNRFFDNSADTKWLIQPGIITKQINLTPNGIPLTMLQQDFSLDGASVTTPAPSITLLTQQVQDYIIPALALFSPDLDESYMTFHDITREQDQYHISPISSSERLKYISCNVQIASLLATGVYYNNAPLSVITCYTLDSITFVARGAALHLILNKASNPEAYIPAAKLIDYVKSVEEAYNDKNGLITAARIRVHYYGNSIPLKESGPSTSALGLAFSILGRFGSTYALGKVFDAAVARAPTNVSLDYHTMQGSEESREAYNRLTTHADENGIESNPSPYIVLQNPASSTTTYIDLGHTLYGFEAWQWEPGGPTAAYADTPIPRIR